MEQHRETDMLTPGDRSSSHSCHEHLYREYQRFLHVVLHGLFAVHIQRDHIELLSPFVPEHSYRAGNFDIKRLYTLERNGVYSLVGVQQHYDPPPLTHNCNIIIDKFQIQFSIKRSASYVAIKLPFPYEINPARLLPRAGCFAGRTAEILKPNGIALCQVLTFRVGCFGDVRLWGTGWKPNVRTIHELRIKVAKLHLWAEPEMRMQMGHERRAYKALMDMVPPIDLEPIIPTVNLSRDDTGIVGLDPQELKGLSEWDGVRKPRRHSPDKPQMYSNLRSRMNKSEYDPIVMHGMHGTRSSNCQSIFLI